MPTFWVILVLWFGSLEAVLECSQSYACSGEVINCQCQDDQATQLLWRVFRAGESSVLFLELYTTTSPVGDSDTRGDYSVVLNSTEPLSSQLSLTISQPAVTVQCALMSIISTTLQRIDVPPSPPVNLQSQGVGDLVTLSWEPTMEDSVITGYLVNVTSQVSVFSQQLRTNNTSVSIHLNTTGEYLVQVMAMNCAGTSQYASLVFNTTLTQSSTTESSTTTTSTIITTSHNSINTFSTTEAMPTSMSSLMPTSSASTCLEPWHIGIASSMIVIIQVVCTAICVVAVTVAMKHKQGKATSFSEPEGHGPGVPAYEDITVQSKGDIELEENVAYGTHTSTRA